MTDFLDEVLDKFEAWAKNYYGEPYVDTPIDTYNPPEAKTAISQHYRKEILEARIYALDGVLELTNGRTYSDSTDWSFELNRIMAIVNKRKEDSEAELSRLEKE